jgi:hypothetical protein
MDKEGNAAVIWFRRSLLFHKLEPRYITSDEALGDGFKSFVVGLGFFLAILAIIVFIHTNSKLDTGQFAELSGFCVIPILNVAVLSGLLFGFLQLLGVGANPESVVVLCCFALGGLLPFVSVGMGLFLDRAVQLALEHGDPSLPYLKAAVYQVLFEDEQVWSVKAIVWFGVSISLLAIGCYISRLIVLLSKVSRHGSRALVALATICAWLIDGLVVTKALDLVFWRIIIQQAVGHHG